MKKCPQCHQESLDEAHFCANCGASLDLPLKKLSRQAKRKQVETEESDGKTKSSSLSTPSQDQETLSDSSQEEDSSAKSKEEKEENTASSKEKKLKNSAQKSKKEEPSSKDKDDQDSKEKQEEKKDKESKWHSFLFQKKEEENEEEEDEGEEDHPEDMQRMLFIAVCFLGLLVIFLSGLLIYQDFSSNTHDEGEVVVQNQPSLSEEILETNSIQKESSASTQSETREVSTKTFSLTHEEGRVLPRRAGEPREESSTQSSKESSEEKSSTKSTKSSTTTSSSNASYQANYVMNVRSGPSIDEDQVSQIDEGETVDVDKTQKNSDGSTWGRLEGSENWVCLFDSDTEYFTEITTQSESTPVAKVNLDDLIAQVGGSIWNLFDDAVFIGDSRVYGFMSYGFIPSTQVLAAGGYTIQNISEYLSSVALLQPEVIYLSFGINDMGLNIGQDEGENGYAKVYTCQIEALLDR
ncbi:MAG: hypothetical protein K2H85_09990, partial [Allobaculum sp.]|nr:hypothetical protein [Allobaculum sp.]